MTFALGVEVTVPLHRPGAKVRVVTLYQGKDPGPFGSLQGMRSGLLKRLCSDPDESETARAYQRNLARYARKIADMVIADFDAVVSPQAVWHSKPSDTGRQFSARTPPFSI